ncbi:MAG: hypothetical protein KKE20_05345 [Nanoarchaeota archaeon]|nr:hypothetical protein [Nanoarchaeota archaeon]
MNQDYSIRVRRQRIMPRRSFPESVGQLLFCMNPDELCTGDYKKRRVQLRDDARMEVILPQYPLEEAIYLAFFPDKGRLLEDSALARVTDTAQLFMGLLNKEGLHELTARLRKEYDENDHKRYKGSIGVCTYNCSLTRFKIQEEPGIARMPVEIVFPQHDYCLAKSLEEAVQTLGFMDSLEKKGYAHTKKQIKSRVDDIRFISEIT